MDLGMCVYLEFYKMIVSHVSKMCIKKNQESSLGILVTNYKTGYKLLFNPSVYLMIPYKVFSLNCPPHFSSLFFPKDSVVLMAHH